ncbi:hypothetical protein [Undibacterium crateris]|nr:hypothetical protein [Undibacterium crateris]NDI86438.1 hypothetical protein [Undibacterium crateris]
MDLHSEVSNNAILTGFGHGAVSGTGQQTGYDYCSYLIPTNRQKKAWR